MLRGLLPIVFVFLGLLPAPVAAQLLGDAQVGFSADRKLVIDGRSFTGKVYAMPGRQRHEQQIEGIPQVILLRSDGQGWLVVPTMKSYVEFRLGRALAELGDPSLLSTPVGHEKVNGIETTKYRIEHTVRDGSMVDGWLWRSAEGVIMRLDGTFTPRSGRATSIRMELSHVRLGPQPAALFRPPEDMMRLPASALEPLLGVGRGQ